MRGRSGSSWAATWIARPADIRRSPQGDLIAMHPLALAALVIAATPPADEGLRVLDEAREPRKMLHSFLMAEAGKSFDARRRAVAELKTPEAWRRRQVELRGRFLAALGAFPGRTPLNARVVGRDRRDGYDVERVIFESRPGHHVTAELYLPEAAAPSPACSCPAATAPTARRPSRTSGPASCWPRTAWPPSATTRSARASGSSALDDAGQARDHGQHHRAHDGRHRGPARRPTRRALPDLGRRSAASTTWPAGPRSTRRGSAARATRAAARRPPT